jgi:hypothetical protein
MPSQRSRRPARLERRSLNLVRVRCCSILGHARPRTLSDIGELTITIVCGPCARRGRYAVTRLLKKHGDARLTDLLQTLANCPKARSQSIHDRCRVRYAAGGQGGQARAQVMRAGCRRPLRGRAWLRRRLEPRQRRTQRVKARRVGISVFFDDAPDCRCHRSELVVGEVNCRHGPGYNRATFVQQGEGHAAARTC